MKFQFENFEKHCITVQSFYDHPRKLLREGSLVAVVYEDPVHELNKAFIVMLLLCPILDQEVTPQSKQIPPKEILFVLRENDLNRIQRIFILHFLQESRHRFRNDPQVPVLLLLLR